MLTWRSKTGISDDNQYQLPHSIDKYLDISLLYAASVGTSSSVVQWRPKPPHYIHPVTGVEPRSCVEVVGDNLINVLRSGNSMLEHINQNGLLRTFYEKDVLCAGPASRWLSRIVSQIYNRFPSINNLKIGAGTGATTSAVLRALDGTYASYTFTGICGVFLPAAEEFGKDARRMLFKTFNMEKDAKTQGFVEGSYNVLLAMNVLHVPVDVEATMANIRRLLKPG